MATTTYTVFLNGTAVEGETRSRKATVIELAEARKGEGQVEVRTGNGTVVHTVNAPQVHAKPWTRTDSTEAFDAPEIEGYTLAYKRNRVQAGVYRSNDKAGWLVVQGEDRFEAKTTVEAREITNRLAAEHKARREAEREAARVAKAEAKAAKEAAKAEAEEATSTEAAA